MDRRTLLQLSTAASLTATSVFAQTTVTISHPSPETSHFGVAASAFAEYIEAASDGRYTVTVERTDNEREALESVQLDAQQFSIGTTGAAGNFVPEVRVFDIPFLFRDYAHARATLDGPIGRAVLDRFADAENQLHIAAWKAIGVLPTPMAFSELPTALQQGTVDGQENPIPVILSNNFDQLQDHLYLTGHVYSPGIVVGSPDFLDSLDAADRAIFDAAALEAVHANREQVEADEASGIAELRARGMDVVEVDGSAYRDAMAQVTATFEDQFGGETIAAIKATGSE